MVLTAGPDSPGSPFFPLLPRLPGGPGGPATDEHVNTTSYSLHKHINHQLNAYMMLLEQLDDSYSLFLDV